MANRRWLHALTRHASAIFSANTTLPSIPTPALPSQYLEPLASKFVHHFTSLGATQCPHWSHPRHLSSNGGKDEFPEHDNEDVDDDDDDDDEMGESSEDENVGPASASNLKTEYTPEEREAEVAAIGYKVVGPLERSDRVFKPYESVFAVVQIGSHQFKVAMGIAFSRRD
ncbi:50S ribosomal protein L21, mitochondrial [Morella rubra]|uniref:50S ribosomal protein L21, mitochondrial n=1 Tax=Morella rubra TaxID=262757 RepID=A0A6A1WCV9_9ROSI|nr:50S ribosomal protein L21, mitochondrial [Morella rubra]